MTEVETISNESTNMNSVYKTVHRSALTDHDYVGTKKYAVVPIPGVTSIVNPYNTITKQEKAIPKKKRKRSLNDRIEKDDNDIKPMKRLYHCQFCSFTTKKKGLSSKHQSLHKPIKLMSCNNNCIKDQNDFKCPDCSFVAKSNTGLRVHAKIHTNGTPYKCIECEFSGKDLKELIKHYKDTKDIKCPKCTYKTHVKSAMVAHKLTHTSQRPFSCGICATSFKNRGNLYVHMRKHKNIELIEVSASDLK